MGSLNLKITTRTSGLQQVEELSARLADLSPVFQNVVDLWAQENTEKFLRGAGQEADGVDQGAGVWWEQLTPGYMKSKRRAGYEDSLMKRTGALEAALSHRGAFSEYISPMTAVFGTPLDPEDAAKVGFNWMTRPTVFLDQQDRLGIKREISNYLSYGDNYREQILAASLAPSRSAAMDAEMRADIDAEAS